MSSLERLVVSVRDRRPVVWFTWFVRVMLALGFLPSGMIKVLGIPFTKLPTTDPVGYFFDALLRTGELYPFIGVCQLVAAVLLLVPRTATVGALVYLPIIAGIEVLTLTVPFQGTWVITTLMLLGVIYLLVRDVDRLAALVRSPESDEVRIGRAR
jgi:hypothetical protein